MVENQTGNTQDFDVSDPWVQHYLLLSCSEPQVMGLLRESLAEQGFFNFNKLVPVPQGLPMTKIFVEENEEKREASNQGAIEFFCDMLSPEEEWKRDHILQSTYYVSEERYRELQAQFGCTNSVEWCEEHWGTSEVGTQTTVVEDDGENILLHFRTYKQSPTRIFDYLQAQGVDLLGVSYKNAWPEVKLYGSEDEVIIYFNIEHPEGTLDKQGKWVPTRAPRVTILLTVEDTPAGEE